MSDKINDDLTIDIECPVCEKLLPRRGVKGKSLVFITLLANGAQKILRSRLTLLRKSNNPSDSVKMLVL